MRVLSACLVVGLLLVPLARAGDDGVVGNWKVTIWEDGNQVAFWLVRLDNKDGKLTGTVEPLSKVPPTTLGEAKVSGDLLEFTLKVKNGPVFHFEGKLPQAGGKKVFGSLARGNQMIAAVMEATPAKNSFELDREILVRTPNDPRVFGAVMNLIARGKEHKVPAKDLQEWVDTALRTADNFGPRWRLDLAQELVEALLAKDAYGSVAAATARSTEKLLDAKAPFDARLRVLTALGSALKQTGEADQAKEVEARIDGLEVEAYSNYEKNSQAFKVAKYSGRKAKSNRAVLVELFTGAQCPPCVGADLAFDALPKGFDAQDVVLLQYHLHVPGPDALTNADTEARAGYYGNKIEGTPTAFLNGKKSPAGGGDREDAEELFMEYRKAIGPMLEAPATAQLQASAIRRGDKIHVHATVQDLDKPSDKVKLRIALVEDTVRYKGRNGLGYHHRVVRAFPGGAGGLAVPKKEVEQNVIIDLGDVRKSLTKYLDDSAREEPFLDNQRPMRLRNLSVVAFIQDDATKEILQAIHVPVKEE